MLKRYYSIQDAVDFLNLELKKNLTPLDIVEIAARGEIRLCTWFDGLIIEFKDDLLVAMPVVGSPIYEFRGYIKIPLEVIKPRGGIVEFESIEIIEIVQSREEFQLSRICFPYFWGTYTCIPETGEVKRQPLKIDINDAVIPTEDILALLAINQKKKTSEAIPVNQHKSNMLTVLNQASNKFWANVNRNDPGTYPKKLTIVAWLEKNGFSQTLAEKGATIIRPEWAPKGRIPEE